MNDLSFKVRAVRAIPGMIVHHFGGSCPWQAEGTYFGNPFTIRYRSDSASMTTYDDTEKQEPLMSSIIDNYSGATKYDSFLAEDEALELMKALVLKLRPVSADNPTSGQRLLDKVNEVLGEMETGE